MADKKYEVIEDAVVQYADAEIWVTELMGKTTTQLEDELLPEEPALVAVACEHAKRMEESLLGGSTRPDVARKMADRVYRCGLVTAMLTQRGYRKLMMDLLVHKDGEATRG